MVFANAAGDVSAFQTGTPRTGTPDLNGFFTFSNGSTYGDAFEVGAYTFSENSGPQLNSLQQQIDSLPNTLAEVLEGGSDGNSVDQTNLGSITLAADKILDLTNSGALLSIRGATITQNPAEDSPAIIGIIRIGGSNYGIPAYTLSV